MSNQNNTLKNGDNTDVRNNYGETPLYRACIHKNYSFVELLLKYGANPDICDNHGRTPLFVAYLHGEYEIVELLLKYGANPNICDNDGYTPLYSACILKKYEIVKLLLYYEVDMTNIRLNNLIENFILPDDFYDLSTNEDIRSYLIKDFFWDKRKIFINFLDKTGFLYGSNEENKVSNKKNRDALSLDVYLTLLYNKERIVCFLG